MSYNKKYKAKQIKKWNYDCCNTQGYTKKEKVRTQMKKIDKDEME